MNKYQKPERFGIYIHWPFCRAKCPYCDFNSHVADTIDHEQWAQSYKKEIDYVSSQIQPKKITSIFFGGGTPSLMKPKTVHTVLEHLQKKWGWDSSIEITLEANPTSIEAEKFYDFKQAGINRVSIGVQSLNDADLKFLGREHSATEAIQALDIAAQYFDRFSFDLIYARPQQKIIDWEKELKQALLLAKGHLSLYQLTIEQGTPFYTQHQRGDFRIPEADQAGEFYEITQNIMTEAGMPAYEISNHAVSGQESQHNLVYWRYHDYAGFGPGAHGRLTLQEKKMATRTHRAPAVWLERIAQQGHGYHDWEVIKLEDQRIERLMMGLRIQEGLDIENMGLDENKLAILVQEGLIEKNQSRIRPTLAGMQRLNSILVYLV